MRTIQELRLHDMKGLFQGNKNEKLNRFFGFFFNLNIKLYSTF